MGKRGRRPRKTDEERERLRCRGRQKKEREAFPPASPRDGISVERERARGRERNGIRRERGEREKK